MSALLSKRQFLEPPLWVILSTLIHLPWKKVTFTLVKLRLVSISKGCLRMMMSYSLTPTLWQWVSSQLMRIQNWSKSISAARRSDLSLSTLDKDGMLWALSISRHIKRIGQVSINSLTSQMASSIFTLSLRLSIASGFSHVSISQVSRPRWAFVLCVQMSGELSLTVKTLDMRMHS